MHDWELLCKTKTELITDGLIVAATAAVVVVIMLKVLKGMDTERHTVLLVDVEIDISIRVGHQHLV